MSQETYIELCELEEMIDSIKELLRDQCTDELIDVLLKYCDGFDHKSGNNDYLKELHSSSKSKVISLNS